MYDSAGVRYTTPTIIYTFFLYRMKRDNFARTMRTDTHTVRRETRSGNTISNSELFTSVRALQYNFNICNYTLFVERRILFV